MGRAFAAFVFSLQLPVRLRGWNLPPQERGGKRLARQRHVFRGPLRRTFRSGPVELGSREAGARCVSGHLS